MSSADSGIDRPDWLPDEYDPDAPLYERLPLMADIEGGIELHVTGGRYDTTEIVGQPKDLNENAHGVRTLYAGNGSGHNWQWEIVVAPDGDARLESVDPDQEMWDYMSSKKTYLDDVDVRIWGVDAEAWLDREVAGDD